MSCDVRRPSTNVTGVILAGGKSSRMGKDKALLDFHGKPFIEHIAETLKHVFAEVFIVADYGDSYTYMNLPVHADTIKSSGPLAGIHSALSHAIMPSVFILSCDLPLVTAEAIEHLLGIENSFDVVVYSVNGMMQPLCGIYGKSCLTIFEEELKRDKRSVLDALGKVHTLVVAAELTELQNDARIFANINSPAEYYRILESQD